MFTGLIQSLGTVRGNDTADGGRTLRVEDCVLASQLAVGESVAVNGACLTVVARDGDAFSFQVGPETLASTTLAHLVPGDRVNLERALLAGSPIGGHFVTGHVDCVGTLLEKKTEGDWQMVWFGYPSGFADLLVTKGSIAVDGVSLTLVNVERERFSVMLIPFTRDNTTLGLKEAQASVNIEFDMLAKFVRKSIQNMTITI